MVFLDLSKTFDRVSQESLTDKLKCLGVCKKYYGLIQSLLSDRFQRAVLNEQCSKCCHIQATFRLFRAVFFVYVNDLNKGLISIAKIFAEYCTFFVVNEP